MKKYFPIYSIFLLLQFHLTNCQKASLTSSVITFPADGKSGGVIVFENSFGSEDTLIIPESDSIEITSSENNRKGTKLYFKSTKHAGKVFIQTKKGLRLELDFYSSVADVDEDGFPDTAELSDVDAERFRNWFVRIAEAQYLTPNSYWNPNERDCAGLIRYSYREALKKHDMDWFLKSGISLDKNLADVDSFHYPDVPVLGENLFKLKKGDALDLGSFGTFADAETLFRWNMRFISKNIFDSRQGDILFFENSGEIRFPFHSMILAKNTGNEQIVIYHTGEGNILKRVPISYLDKSKIFRISPDNPHFLGVFRFYILE